MKEGHLVGIRIKFLVIIIIHNAKSELSQKSLAQILMKMSSWNNIFNHSHF